MDQNRNSVFTVKKKHAWRSQLLRFIGTGLILLVLVGTVAWLVVSANFSLSQFLSKQLQSLKPEVREQEMKKTATKEEQLSALVDKDKVVEIDSITKTPEEDLLLKAKNGPVVFFAARKSLTDQVATLQTLLTKAKIDNKALKKVDFRFDKTVIEY